MDLFRVVMTELRPRSEQMWFCIAARNNSSAATVRSLTCAISKMKSTTLSSKTGAASDSCACGVLTQKVQHGLLLPREAPCMTDHCLADFLLRDPQIVNASDLGQNEPQTYSPLRQRAIFLALLRGQLRVYGRGRMLIGMPILIIVLVLMPMFVFVCVVMPAMFVVDVLRLVRGLAFATFNRGRLVQSCRTNASYSRSSSPFGT